jgi:MoaE-MoaD fusion protein
MRVRVLFFGMLRDLAGKTNESVELPEGAVLSDLLAHYGDKIPRFREFLPSIAVSVNQEYSMGNTPLQDQDEVGLLPPVSGGAQASPTAGQVAAPSRIILVRDPINQQQIVEKIKRSSDGAITTFDGIVRDNSRGRSTLYLEYEAYEAMALRQLESLAEQAIARFEIRDVAIAHRLGRLEIGETSVLIAVAAAHRAAAFEACKWLIDNLKKTVPIWKKEYFADGAMWADGEPFPPEIRPR